MADLILSPTVVAHVDDLPRLGVRAFICAVAEANQVVYERSMFDEWTEAVSRAAGDDVRLDPTEKLLMLLTRQNIVSGRQASRLLSNYFDERERARCCGKSPEVGDRA